MAKSRRKTRGKASTPLALAADYDVLLGEISDLLETARRAAARSVNAVITATYWEIGRRVDVLEIRGKDRADYGEQIVRQLGRDLTQRFGRGFSRSNLYQMRAFYRAYAQTVQTVSGQSELACPPFPLPWSHYVALIAVRSNEARRFYEDEAIRGGWSIRQLKRQINSQFYERTLLSRNKAAMLRKGEQPTPADAVTPEEEIKDPLVLEFLDLKDEYSESDLEEALILKLESFLLELGGDFAFVGRQRRLRIDDEWFRVDLLFFHRRLHCLVVVDLKLGEFTHADAGQMHLYLNYARENWTLPGENPPVGLILCASKRKMLAKYALEGLPNKVLATEYRTTLPDEKTLATELEQTRRLLTAHSVADAKTTK
jgi:predicted nuclease of restriction endonuclease-like (RecB) superfamily